MTAFNMSDYLNEGVADYDYVLSVSPQGQLIEAGLKKQVIRIADDGSEERITLDDDINFVVTFNWNGLTESEMGDIIDLYFNPSKANGIENTFYWTNPMDSVDYVVRFMGVIVRDIGPSWVHAMKRVQLKVIQYKGSTKLLFGTDNLAFGTDHIRF